MEYSIIQFCKACIDDVLEGEIEFTEPVCICEVDIGECDNLERGGRIEYDSRVSSRGTVSLED